MEHVVVLLNEENNEKESHTIHALHLSQVKVFSPLLENNNNVDESDPIPFEVNGAVEFEAARVMISWIKRENALDLKSMEQFRALAMLADKYDIPLLREALSVIFF